LREPAANVVRLIAARLKIAIRLFEGDRIRLSRNRVNDLFKNLQIINPLKMSLVQGSKGESVSYDCGSN